MDDWQATRDEQQHIVAVLHCAEAIAKDYREPVFVLRNLKYVRESRLRESDKPRIVERIDPYLY